MRRLTFVLAVVLCTTCASPIPSPRPTPTAVPTPTAIPTPTASPTRQPTPTPNPLAPADQQVLRIQCCYTDPRNLRPQAASGPDELAVINAIQRGLLYRDGEGNLVPSLATALPTVSADGLTYTYHLRDAQYSDGAPIVAADIVRAARQLADPRNAFDYVYLMCYVEGADSLMGSDFCSNTDKPTPYLDPEAGTFDDATIEGLLDQLGVTAPDDHTVVFQLAQPTSFWPDITAMWLLTPLPESQTSWAEAADIVSSGPFKMDTWRHNQRIDLVPNPYWYGLAPTLQRIEFDLADDPLQAVARVESGLLDEVRVPTSEVPRFLDSQLLNRSGALQVEYYDFANCQDPTGRIRCPLNASVTKGIVGESPTQNVHFRQALTQAIDKADMIKVAFGGIGSPAFSPTMPGIPGFPTVTEDSTLLGFDPVVALANLKAALGELGVAGPDAADVLPATDTCDDTCQHTRAWAKMLSPLRFGYNCDSGREAQVQYMAQQWRDVLGFDGDQFDVRCVDFAVYRGPFRGYSGDINRNGWRADFPHPDNQNRDIFTCGGRNNRSGYCNPAYDALLDQGAAAASYADSLPFYHQAEQLLVHDAPVLFLRYWETYSLIQPWVINYVQTPWDNMNVGDTFYETIQIAAH